jgi:hypothetical protein
MKTIGFGVDLTFDKPEIETRPPHDSTSRKTSCERLIQKSLLFFPNLAARLVNIAREATRNKK